jgi:hypothetical protein
MSKCEWGKDDYSLNISHLPQTEVSEAPQKNKRKVVSIEADLFDTPTIDKK